MQIEITREHRRDLLALSQADGLAWGGLYGKDLPQSLRDLITAGYVQEVRRPYIFKRISFNGGFRITVAGRRALALLKAKEARDGR